MIEPDRTTPAARARILVVDDDRLVLSTLRDELRSRGYAVITAVSGEDAIAIAAAQHPDLLLMDIRLPGMSGIETARRIQETGTVPVLFLSAFDDREVVQEAVREGGLGYLVKPVQGNQLEPAVEAALARAEDLRKLRASEENLRTALAGDRSVSIAVGLIMERYRLSSADYFEALRRHARSQRRKIHEVAAELVSSSEALNAVAGEIDFCRPDSRE